MKKYIVPIICFIFLCAPLFSSPVERISINISKDEIQQKFNNMDNGMRGLRAGPYRKNGRIEGCRLIRVKSYNILYMLGFRSGDIVKGVDGQKIDSAETLARIWETIIGKSKLIIDVERGGESITFEVNIKDDAVSGGSSLPGERKSQNINKTEVTRKELSNIDKGMWGFRAGPYRKDGKIEGYQLIRVRPHNIFYKIGFRRGDIIKGVNRQKIDSPETL
ncbi:MAG: hypothetical protein GY754_14900, partial [bacterium]|nr:hypothetical protein [bacterium]